MGFMSVVMHYGLDAALMKRYIESDKKIKDGKLNLILIDKNYNAFATSNFNNKNFLKVMH